MKEFKDLVFKKREFGGFSSITVIAEHTLSVQCGQFLYCNPRKNLSTPNEYSSFEIAIIRNNDDVWVTKDFTDCGDDVAGWVDRKEITEVIKYLNL
tara:strand:+ start:269 stop:556 length:288 start_codon:yes stop_codon:yes gene_type:complete